MSIIADALKKHRKEASDKLPDLKVIEKNKDLSGLSQEFEIDEGSTGRWPVDKPETGELPILPAVNNCQPSTVNRYRISKLALFIIIVLVIVLSAAAGYFMQRSFVLEKQMSTSSSKLSSLSKEYNILGKEKKDLITHINRLSKEGNRSKALLRKKIESPVEINQRVTQSLTEKFEKEKSILQDTISQLKDELTVKKKEREALKTNLSSNSKEVLSSNDEIKKLKKSIAFLEKQHKAALSELNNEQSAFKKKLTKEKKKLLNKVIRLKASVSALNEKNYLLEKKNSAYQKKLKDWDKRFADRETEFKTQVEDLTVRLKNTEEEAETAKGRISGAIEKSRQERRDMHYNLGVVYSKNRFYKESAKEYKKALDIDPDDADTHYNLGVLYDIRIKDKDRAIYHYERYIELSPDSPDVTRVLKWIEGFK